MTHLESFSSTKTWQPNYQEPLTDLTANELLNKKVFYVRQLVIEEAKNSPHVDPWFLTDHLFEVERLALSLCSRYPEADLQLVDLAVWFHDIERLRGNDNDHDILGADEAQRVLQELGFTDEEVSIVVEACKCNSCKKYLPQSLEAQILATADALSHFFHDFYKKALPYHIRHSSSKEMALEIILQKIDRDFNEKIFFDEAKELARPIYESLIEEFTLIAAS